jgi:hypothetical protein
MSTSTAGDITLALLVDLEHRDHHLLQRCAAMHKAATGALQAQAVDRLGNLHLHFTGQTKLLGVNLCRQCLGKPLAEHEAAVPDTEYCSPSASTPEKVALVDSAVLVDETMIRRSPEYCWHWQRSIS